MSEWPGRDPAARPASGPPDSSSAEPETALRDEALSVARELFGLTGVSLSRLSGGRVNDTFLLRAGEGRFVLQRINDFFQGPAPAVPAGLALAETPPPPPDTAVGDNWRRVYLAVAERSGRPVPPIPPIYPDREGRWLASFPRDSSAGAGTGCWRLTGYMEGLPAPKTAAGAAEAAGLLGFFHCRLNQPLPVELRPLPEGPFTNQHLSTPWELERIFDDYRGHPLLEELSEPLARAVRATSGFLARPDFPAVFSLRDVIIHGDPKADNFLFSPDGRALAMIDWDSVGLGHVLVDVAELLRSWAGFGRGDRPEPEVMSAAMAAYGAAGLELHPDEVEMLPAVLRAIILNLCRRYLIDALAQVYFRWDSAAYPSLFHQNRARAEALLGIAEYLVEAEISLGRVLSEGYAAGRRSRIQSFSE